MAKQSSPEVERLALVRAQVLLKDQLIDGLKSMLADCARRSEAGSDAATVVHTALRTDLRRAMKERNALVTTLDQAERDVLKKQDETKQRRIEEARVLMRCAITNARVADAALKKANKYAQATQQAREALIGYADVLHINAIQLAPLWATEAALAAAGFDREVRAPQKLAYADQVTELFAPYIAASDAASNSKIEED